MPNNRFLIIPLVLFGFNVGYLFGQAYDIKGKVLEEQTLQPIAYSTVALYTEIDSTLVNGVISDEEGKFNIEVSRSGSYYIQISALGFGKKNVLNIVLNNSDYNMDIGTIFLSTESIGLDGVEVAAERAAIEYKADRKLIDIAKLGVPNNAPLSEALQVLPSVETDMDGNVRLRGSGNFQVLINGKPSPLSGSEVLQQYTAAQIEKIEVITNPSAKYQANNTSGIINLILKSGGDLGLSGLVNLGSSKGIAKWQPYVLSSTINYKREKYGITAFANLSNTQYDFFWTGTQRRANGLNLDKVTMNPVPIQRTRTSLDFDYFITDSHTITLAGRFIQFDNEFGIQDENYPLNTGIPSFFSRAKGSTIRHTAAVTLSDKIEFNEDGKDLLTTLTYFNQTIDEDQTFIQSSDNALENIDDKRSFAVNSNHNQTQFTLDYTNPIGEKGRLEMGTDFFWVSRNSRRNTQEFFPETSPLIDRFTFDNRNYAGYATFSNTWSGLDFQLGFRIEHYSRSIKQDDTDISYDYEKLNFFPSLHLSKKIGDKKELKLSYTRRIQRPSMFQLQPYLNWGNNTFSYGGNPNLIPANINTTELSYTQWFGKVTLAMEVYFRNNSNHISNDGAVLNEETGILEATPVNIDRSKFYGIEPSIDITTTKWLKIKVSGAYFRNKISGILFDENILIKNNAWRARLNFRISLPKDIKFNINGFYDSKILGVQTEKESTYWVNLSTSIPVFKKQGTLSFNYTDILGTRQFNEIQKGTDFIEAFKFRFPRQIVGIDLSYKFKNFKDKENKFEFED
jgi:outer membrane receptor protein involved in Fe transport